ncbi:MAG: DUF3572 domain-containing protein [Pseudomonadota bacterium]
MTSLEAERLAIAALGYLAEDQERVGAFLASAGAAPGDLRERAADPAFLGFVLDHLLMADASVIEFAANAGIAPEMVARARAALPGGDTPDWT